MIDRTTAAEVIAWAKCQNLCLPESNRLDFINVERKRRQLRPFVVIGPEMQIEEDRISISREISGPHMPRYERAAMQKEKVINPPVSKQSAADLRDILFQEMIELRAGESDPQKSIAVAKLAAQIVSTYKVDFILKMNDTKKIDG